MLGIQMITKMSLWTIHLNVMDQAGVGPIISVLVSNMTACFATDPTKGAYGIQMIVYKTPIVQNTPHQALSIQEGHLKNVS